MFFNYFKCNLVNFINVKVPYFETNILEVDELSPHKVILEASRYGNMKAENVEEFTRRFEEYVSNHILPEQLSAVIDIDAEIDFRDITPKFHSDLKRFNPFGPDNHKPVFCTYKVYDYGTSKVVGREQEHIKLELVDNKSNNVMNGIAFGQSSQVRYIKTKQSFDICYTIEENTHKRGEVQLQIEDIKPRVE